MKTKVLKEQVPRISMHVVDGNQNRILSPTLWYSGFVCGVWIKDQLLVVC